MQLPEIYRDEQSLPRTPYAISFVMTQSQGINLKLMQLLKYDETTPFNQLPISLIEFLATNKKELLIGHNGASWKLSRA